MKSLVITGVFHRMQNKDEREKILVDLLDFLSQRDIGEKIFSRGQGNSMLLILYVYIFFVPGQVSADGCFLSPEYWDILGTFQLFPTLL